MNSFTDNRYRTISFDRNYNSIFRKSINNILLWNLFGKLVIDRNNYILFLMCFPVKYYYIGTYLKPNKSFEKIFNRLQQGQSI